MEMDQRISWPWPPEYDCRVAKPGDPDLSLHLFGLTIHHVGARASGTAAAAYIEFDTSQATGFWTGAETGERVFPDRVRSLSSSMLWESGPAACHAVAAQLSRLFTWQAMRVVIAMTAAPGRQTLLHAPGAPGGTVVVHPAGDAHATAAAYCCLACGGALPAQGTWYPYCSGECVARAD